MTVTKRAVEIERHGEVAVIRFCREDVHNAMDRTLLREFRDATARISEDESVRAVVIAGGERAFSAGGDLGWITALEAGAGAAVHELAGILHESIVTIRRMPKPVIAAIRGVAAGAGMSLALACDLRVIGRGVRFVLSYGSRGLSVDGGASFSLPRLVGLARAIEIAALDEPIFAERALALGLATRVVDDDRVEEGAIALGERLAGRSPHAFGVTKRLFVDSFHETLERQLDAEREALVSCAEHPDGEEGLSAFTEKRAPAFAKAAAPAKVRARR